MKQKITFIILAQCLVLMSYGQNFSFHSINPFGIKTIKDDGSRSAQKVMFSDFDNDGDLDVFYSGLDSIDEVEEPGWNNIHYFLEMQENTGDVNTPQFGQREALFDDFPFQEGYFFPCAGDLNSDGMVDFIIYGAVDFIGNRTMIYAKNISTGGVPKFENIRLDSSYLPKLVPESFFIPELVDLDHDGDLDLLMSGFDPAFGDENGPDVPVNYYAQNIGTAAEPWLVGLYADPFGLKQNPLIDILCTGDIDNDGDVDALGTNIIIPADSINTLFVHLNNPKLTGEPVFDEILSSPFGLPTSFGEEQLMFPNLVDLDGDSDLDLFVFKVTEDGLKLNYYENDLCTVETGTLNAHICEGSSILINGNEYSTPGNYEIVVPGSDGCDSIILLTLEVESVDASVTTDQNTITATVSNAIYQWVDCDSGLNIPDATGQSYTAVEIGNYAVNVISLTGCSAMSECISIVTSGIREIGLDEGINIYPNPADNNLYVLNTTKYKVMSLTISDISGRELKEVMMFGKNSVDISSLPPGVYLINIRINGKDVVRKLVVK